MAEVKELMTRLETARAKADSLASAKSRLTGELEATNKRLTELEKKCEDEFDCKIDALPDFVMQLELESEKSLNEAEVVLGLREGKVEAKKEYEENTDLDPTDEQTPADDEEDEEPEDDPDEDEDALFDE